MATYREHTRYNFPRLRVTRYTTYYAVIHGEQELLKHRYAFEQEGTGERFVYTGVDKYLREGQVYDIRGTIKQERDKFGFIRLSRIRKVELDPELPL